MASLHFHLVSPEHTFIDKPIHMVVIPGIDGDIGVLEGHAPLLTLLRPGVITVYEETQPPLKIFVDGGFAEVTPQKCVALITEGISLEALDKQALELQIKQLIDDVAKSVTAEEREKADTQLMIARAKLMETLASNP